MTWNPNAGPRPTLVQLPGMAGGARVLRALIRPFARGAPAAADPSRDEAGAVQLVAEAIDILRESMDLDADQAVGLLTAEAARAGRSMEAQAAVVVDRALRSAAASGGNPVPIEPDVPSVRGRHRRGER